MNRLFQRLSERLWTIIWGQSPESLPPARARAVRAAQAGHMLVREFRNGHLQIRAASLVYTTLLSIVPALAVSFAVMKAFNVHEELRPMLFQFLAPLGDKGVELGVRLLDFVEHLNLAKLGSAGLGVLLLTVTSLMNKIEQALNYTWRVDRSRRFFDRFGGYFTVVMVGPLLVFTAIGFTASLMGSASLQEAASVPLVGTAIDWFNKLVPILLVIAAFTFIYVYIPNTRVRVPAALFGAVVAGVLWVSLGWLFASLVATSARYTLIYSSFAILILFMMWLYIGWLVVLVGGSVAFYRQNPEYLGLLNQELRMSSRVRERLGMNACFLIAQHHEHGLAAWSAVGLARRLDVPLQPLHDLLRALVAQGVLMEARGESPAYVPARAPSGIRLVDLLAAVRSAHESPHLSVARISCEPALDEVLAELDRASADALGERSLGDLAALAPLAGGHDAPLASVTVLKGEPGGAS
jgi:membrane protein